MAIYVRRNGKFTDKSTGEPMTVHTGKICAPMIVSDIPEYRSPIDGRVISSRSQRRDDLKRNNCVEYEPSLSPTNGKFKNAKFANKVGKTVAEEFRA